MTVSGAWIATTRMGRLDPEAGPTGRKISIRLCKVLEIRDSKILAEREYLDMADLIQQHGVAPALAHA